MAAAVLPPTIAGGRMSLVGAPAEATAVVFMVASRTGMMVKRPAVGAEGFVLDPYDARATQTHLATVGERLMQAYPAQAPYAVFSDSLEVYGSDWTGDMPAQFRVRRGYDLTPHLPQLFEDTGPEDAAIRHDWGQTLTELANDNFLNPMHRWAQQHHTLLRSQTYGIPPVTLWSNRFVDLPEGEGKATTKMWRQFLRSAMGLVCRSSSASSCGLFGDVDVVALAGVCRDAARHEGGGRSSLPGWDQPIGRPWLALLAAR